MSEKSKKGKITITNKYSIVKKGDDKKSTSKEKKSDKGEKAGTPKKGASDKKSTTKSKKADSPAGKFQILFKFFQIASKVDLESELKSQPDIKGT